MKTKIKKIGQFPFDGSISVFGPLSPCLVSDSHPATPSTSRLLRSLRHVTLVCQSLQKANGRADLCGARGGTKGLTQRPLPRALRRGELRPVVFGSVVQLRAWLGGSVDMNCTFVS